MKRARSLAPAAPVGARTRAARSRDDGELDSGVTLIRWLISDGRLREKASHLKSYLPKAERLELRDRIKEVLGDEYATSGFVTVLLVTFRTKHAVATLLTKLSQAKASKRFDDLAERILEEPYYRDEVSCSTNAELADVLVNWMAARLKKQRCAGSDDEWRA